MNLFLIGRRAAGGLDAVEARTALERLVEELPFFPGRPLEAWSSSDGLAAAAWVRHELPYVRERGGSIALFSGRPFRWTDDGAADGRAPADATFFLEPADGWIGQLDGRFAAATWRAADGALDLVTDPVGAYPLHTTEHGGTRWFSNSAAALRALRGGGGYRLDALAGLLGGGWPLEGHPIWEGLSRVEPGVLLRVARDGETVKRLSAPPQPGQGLDGEGAERRLVAATSALADWPARPNVVPVTGGRDSRVVLAAALAAGFEFEGVTGGAPGEPDVEVGRQLCEAAGVPHSLLPADPFGNLWSDHRRAARIIRLTAGGTASLADAAGFPMGPREGPLPLWHSGQGGEIGRSYYGSGDGMTAGALAERLYDGFSGRRAHRRDLLSAAGRELVESQIRGWVDAKLAAGYEPGDIPDLFYLERRMATWAAPTHGCVEYVRDTTSPLWSRRVVDDLLAAPARERASEPYHRQLVERLAPRLADLTFAGGPWDASQGRLRRARSLTGKAARAARRRLRRRHAGDPLQPILDDVREQALAAASHPAWDVLERRRCEALLTQPAASLDEMSRYYVWRLATVFVE